MSLDFLNIKIILAQVNKIGQSQTFLKDREISVRVAKEKNIEQHSRKESDDVPETKDISEGPGKLSNENHGLSNKKQYQYTKDKSKKKEKSEDKINENFP